MNLSLFNHVNQLAIRSFPKLDNLTMSRNYIDDDDFSDMITFFKQVVLLRHLDLTENPFAKNYVYNDKVKSKKINKQ